MFAFAIWDQVERTLFCARDRAGEKPLYYAALAGTFLFASEPKAFSSWPTFARRMHYPALLDYLAYGFVPDPKCIWENCAKLPPGHCMVVRAGTDGRPRVTQPRSGGIGASIRSLMCGTGRADCSGRSPARPWR
jgi:asparagine synthase (glutamine-hydrolysing)